MRQRGLQQSDGIQRHAFGVRRLFSFGVGDWLRQMLTTVATRGCGIHTLNNNFISKDLIWGW